MKPVFTADFTSKICCFPAMFDTKKADNSFQSWLVASQFYFHPEKWNDDPKIICHGVPGPSTQPHYIPVYVPFIPYLTCT